jgi:peroxiredoxin
VQRDLAEFEARDAQVVAIGQGSAEQAAHYCGKASVDFPCLGDPERSGYRAAGMERGTWWSVAIRDLIMNPIESLTQVAQADFKAAALRESDPLQLGGITIIDTKGTLRYRHLAKRPDDLPENEEIWQALDEIRSG